VRRRRFVPLFDRAVATREERLQLVQHLRRRQVEVCQQRIKGIVSLLLYCDGGLLPHVGAPRGIEN
jgi:hypothetical protein